MKQYDYLLVGSGLFAGVFAYFAGKQGKKCLVLEKRDHLGGNIYCEEKMCIRDSDITGLTVVLEGETYQLESRGKDSDRKWTYAGEETDTAALLDALLALEAESFTEEAPAGKEEIRMTVFLDNENYPQVTVALYRYDGEYCLAEVDGEPVSLVPVSYTHLDVYKRQ